MKKTILVIPHRAIGDVIFQLPLIKILNEQSRLIIISSPTNKCAEILENFENTKVIYYDLLNKKNFSKIKFFFNFKRLLNTFNVDEIYFLARTTYIILPILASKIKIKKLIYNSIIESKLSRKKFNSTRPTKLTLDFIAKNFKIESPNFHLFLDERKHEKQIKKFLDCKTPWIFFSIDSFHNAPNWEPKHYEELISLASKYFSTVFVNTLPSHEFLLKNINQNKTPNIKFTSKLDWRSIMSIIKNSKIFVGNHSGPGHLADALNVRTIIINNNLNKNALWSEKSANIGKRSTYFNTWEFNEDYIKDYIVNEIKK